MNAKKLLSALCAGAILISSLTVGLSYSSAREIHAEDEIADEFDNVSEKPNNNGKNSDTEDPGNSGETKPLTVPQNLRFEDGFIKWDKVEEAYGYILRIHTGEEEWEYQEITKYFDYEDPDDEAQVEFDRLCYEQSLEFGEYIVDVCSFDEAGNRTEWSEGITAEYAPTLNTPTNFRLSEEEEETLLWDEVEGAYRYNIHIFYDDDDRTLYTTTYTRFAFFQYKWCLGDSGNYWISIQTMDKDYNLSEWTEPILISHIRSDDIRRPDAPQNVRFDETGENILWDDVEGADYYSVDIDISYIGENGKQMYVHEFDYPQEAICKNWKRFAFPYVNVKGYRIYVFAIDANGNSSNSSEAIEFTFDMKSDENITVPELQLGDGTESSNFFGKDYIVWDDVENAESYWITISLNGQFLREIYGYDFERYDAGQGNNYFFVGKYPFGNYEATLYVIDKNHNFNKKTYKFTCGGEPDETVWTPKLYYKSDIILWDYDQIRHDNTDCFWVRVINEKSGEIVKLECTENEYFYSFNELPNGYYTVEVCVYEYSSKFGPWSKLLNIFKHGDGLFDKENESTEEIVVPPEIEETIPEEDRVTSITINPAFNMKHKDGNDVELDLTKITIKAEEIYDEEGLKRVEEALGHEIKANQHYNLLDLTLLYDGEDFSNGYDGLVQVIIPIPSGHRDKTFTVYRLTEVDGQIVKEIIPGEQTEDSYIIYLEHFSEYALVGEGEHIHEFADNWKSDESNHWKECECGEKSEVKEHTYTDWTVTKEATETEEGSKERACEVCGYKQSEILPKLSPVDPPKTEEDPNPSTGVSAVETFVIVLSACSAAIVLLSKKRYK